MRYFGGKPKTKVGNIISLFRYLTIKYILKIALYELERLCDNKPLGGLEFHDLNLFNEIMVILSWVRQLFGMLTVCLLKCSKVDTLRMKISLMQPWEITSLLRLWSHLELRDKTVCDKELSTGTVSRDLMRWGISVEFWGSSYAF